MLGAVFRQQEQGVYVDSWMKAEFKHRSLAMRFTADWCGYCPMMAQAMSNAQDQLQGNLEVLSVHCSDSGLASEASGQLTNHYSVFSYPTGLIDCRTFVENSSDIQFTTSRILEAVNYTEENYEVVTSASWTSSLSDTKVSLKLSVYVKTAGTYKVTALLVEDNYIGYQADYNSGGLNDYAHNGIIRAALSDAVGQSFATSDAQVKTFNYTAVLPSDCIADNVRVLVYIQKLDNTTSSYYVDNTATERLGKTKTLDVVSGAWSDDNEGIVPGDDITL